jgi:predicted acetyltransferase
MFQEDHKRLMSEARTISNAARAAIWRALVTARQIERLVSPRSRKIEIALVNAKAQGQNSS